MPIIKSAKKRVKQEAVARSRNTAFKQDLKKELKKLDSAIEGGKKADVEKQLSVVYSFLDKAVKKNLYHKNKSARKKAQAALAASAVVGKAPAPKKAAAPKAAAKPAAKTPAKKAPAKKPATKKA